MPEVAFYSEEELKVIISKGEERKRYGQRNTKLASAPTPKKKVQQPKHPKTREVAELISQLEFDKFHAMVDKEEWNRLHEIQLLCLDQVRDDVFSIPYQKVGRKTVESLNEDLYTDEMYPQLSTEQRALQEGMAPLISELTLIQQETIQLRFGRRLSQRDSGVELGVSKKTVETNEKRAVAALRKLLYARWTPPSKIEEQEVAV